MKKILAYAILLTMLMTFAGSAVSGSLLPDLDEVYGVDVPSFMNVVKREPDDEKETEQEKKEIYLNVNDSDYEAYGILLKEAGCVTESYLVRDGVIELNISCRGHSFSFTYDPENHTAEVVYPEGVSGIVVETASLAQEEQDPLSDREYMVFGSYPQQKDGEDRTPIEWIVLAREGSKVLLLSRYGLDAWQFHHKGQTVTWGRSSIRNWLNYNFLKSAFTEKEQSAIIVTNVDNSKSQGQEGCRLSGGSNTKDRIFLLSYHEAFRQYLTSDAERICYPTEYAAARGAYESRYYAREKADSVWWWLRSPGDPAIYNYAWYVNYDGTDHNVFVYSNPGTVRPALWLDLDAAAFK